MIIRKGKEGGTRYGLGIKRNELQYINSYIDDINSKDGTYSPYISYAGIQHLDGTQI